MTTRIVIDCLSVIMIHLVVDETNNLMHLLLNLDIVTFMYKFLQSKVVEIREYAFKVICLLLFKSKEVQNLICYDIIFDLLSV
jgi:hypothetical protein